jgi:hypothetical protein
MYAGFDIGIKNLAFCIIDPIEWYNYRNSQSKTSGIKLWKNINLIDPDYKCTGLLKNNNICNKKASWVLETKLVDETSYEYTCKLHKSEWATKLKKNKVNSYSIQKLKERAFKELDKIDLFKQVKYIALETQPRINQQMKMFAASIESYFIIRGFIDNNGILKRIIQSPAKNKLKLYKGPSIDTNHIKDPYDKRKYIAQIQTEYYLNKCPEELEEWYNNCKKKDDLADAFLHCILLINNTVLKNKN